MAEYYDAETGRHICDPELDRWSTADEYEAEYAEEMRLKAKKSEGK